MIARRRSSGFTLLETLAVAVIVALGAAVVVASFRAGHQSERTDGELLWMVGAADRRARLESLERGGLMLDARDGAIEVRAGERGEVIHSERLPGRAVVRLLVEGEEDGVVSFDRMGRSADYTVECGSGGGLVRARVSGITGWIVTERGADD